MSALLHRIVSRATLVLISLAAISDVHGQNKTFPVREVSNLLPASSLSTTMSNNVLYIQNDARYTQLTDASFPGKVKYKSNYTLAKLSINHAAANIPTHAYSYKMIYQLDGSTVINDTTYNFSIVDSLLVAYNPDSLTAFQDQDVKIYPNLFNAKLSIIQFYDASVGSGTPVIIPLSTVIQKNLNIELAMQYQPYLKTHYLPSDMALYMHAPSLNATGSVLNVSWSPSTSPYLGKVTPAQYELEWTYADDYDTSLAAQLTDNKVPFNFKNNATRVVLDSTGYQIPIVYPRGYLAMRVRMVRVDSNNYQFPIYGPWSVSTSSGFMNALSGYDRFQISTAHDRDQLNWNYAIQFAEGGKYKHVQSYYDGLLKNRQTITRFNSNPSQLLVTEKIYDYEGRPEITTIPSVVQADSFAHLDGVSISSVTNANYAPSDFDVKPTLCPDEYTVPAFTQGSLANRYYSTLNTDTAGMQKFVPRANGFPFVHAQLSAGYSDRVDRMGGAGDSLQVGRHHDVRNEYLSADQTELDRMLGINAGYNDFYTKTVSKDQNGQYSLSLKDFKGRPVLTSLIGAAVDTSTHAIMFNDEVPDSLRFREDKLDSAIQLLVGHQKIYAGSLYMDDAALTNIQYEYTFAPYVVCPGLGYGIALSVAADYDYTFIDNCGVVDLHRSGTVGTTGIMYSPSPITSIVTDNVTLSKGKHTIDKTLSIRTDQIYAAVDSFFAYPAAVCITPKEVFIKREVEATPFPCPDSLDNPCVLLQRRMEEDMFPDGKYGHVPGTGPSNYINNNSPSAWNVSIFDKMPPDSFAVRYMGPCVSTALNQVSFTRFGITYTNLASMPRDTFIAIFRNAGQFKYDIARALLPLHPEYCKLQNCFVDTFENRFKSFPDGAAAVTAGYFNLDDIVNKDAQLRAKLSFVSGIDDSLKTVWGGRMRMDTILAEMAYCMNDQTTAYTDAKKYFYSAIHNVTFSDNKTRNLYFDKLRSMYLQNRSKYKSMAQTAGSTNCSGCSDTAYRMPLIPPPLIPVIYTPTGAYDTTSYSSFYWLFSGDTIMQHKLAAYMFLSADSLITDPALQQKFKDSAYSYVGHMDSLLTAIAVDSISSRLANCYSNSTQLARLRDTLHAMAWRGEVHNGTFMPWQVRYAITSSGLSLNGLCHPYLLNYGDYYLNSDAARGACKTGAFYDDVRAFLNENDIRNALINTDQTLSSSTLTWTGATDFGNAIAATLGTTNIELRTIYVPANQILRLAFFDASGYSPDSVIITLNHKSMTTSGQSYFWHADDMSFTRIGCYGEDPQASADGYIGRFMFRAYGERYDGSTIKQYTFSGWNNKVPMAEDGDNAIANCVACTQFKQVFEDFADTMTSYGAFYGDHPLFITSLRNFANFNLKKCFGDPQYGRFLSSCALADSMSIPSYGGYGRVALSSGAPVYHTFEAFKTGLMNSPDSFLVLPVAVDSASGTDNVVLDYSNIPFKLLRKFDSVVNACGGSTGVPITSDIGTLLIPQVSISGATIDTVLAGTGFNHGTVQSVVVKRGTGRTAFYRYSITVSGSPSHAQLNAAIAKVDDNMYVKNVHGYWIPTAYATVNKDYYKPEKQQYLRYAYAMQSMSTARVQDTLAESFIEANVSALSTSEVSYTDPVNPNRKTDLYYTLPGDTLSGYGILRQMFGIAKAQLGSNHIFISNSVNTVIATTAPFGHSFNMYRCSDGLYWYRYFGVGAKLYNAYVRVPKWVYESSHPSLTIAGINYLNGDTATRRFNLLLTSSSAPSDTIVAQGSTDFDLAWSKKLQDVMLGYEHPNGPDDPASGEVGSKPDCEQQLLYNAIYTGTTKFNNYIDSFKRALRADFYTYIMGQVGEKLWVEYIDKRFAYTLYSYDLAGNLITTVPPAGVHPLASTSLATVKSLRNSNTVAAGGLPAHDKVTHYEYNSANQPVRELTPDAGQKTMAYDAKGNVILSQTQRQKATGLFTYFLYDGQNRLTETGEVKWADCPSFADQPLYSSSGGWHKTTPPNSCACENITDSVWTYCVPNTTLTYDNILFAKKIRRIARTQVVATVYDSALIDLSLQTGMSKQENLRSRIGANMYFETVPADTSGAAPTTNYTHATHYSYDVEGNVKVLVQEFPDMNAVRQRFKRVDYEYDLISGKVNMLAYNRGFADQFYQRYSYDADNRITTAETSHDGFIWKRDAGYTYYQHGPLARVSFGDQRVQGMDYAYTIQGWLKSINGDRTDTLRDLGADGRKNTVTPKDVYATTIDYFKGDYQPIGGTPATYLASTSKSLYNGNIARQTTDVTPFGAITANYTYDQMNRIRKAGYAKDSAGVLKFNEWYASAYKYDLDGNITALNRKEGSGTTMDSLVYSYPNGAHDNKLSNVLDYATYSPTPTLDLQHYTTTGVSRFTYDADGNLTSDLTSNTTGIKWNIYGKMTDLNTSAGTPYHFLYDGTGNRVAKKYSINSTSSNLSYRYDYGNYYVRDAQGNILAEYNTYSAFNTQSKVATYGGIRGAISGAYPVRTWLTALNTAGYLLQDSFAAYVTGLGGSSTLYPAGYYLANSPSLFGQFVSNANGYPIAIAQYSKSTGQHPLADAFMRGMADGSTSSLTASSVLAQMAHTILTHPDETTRRHALEQLGQTAPDIYAQFLSDYHITLTSSSDSADAANAMNTVATSFDGPDIYAGKLLTLYGEDPNLVAPWLAAVTSDELYLHDSWASDDGYVAMIQDVLNTYGDDAAQQESLASTTGLAKSDAGVYGAASWWGDGMGIVTTLNGGTGGLATLAYTSDPVSYINGLLPGHDPAILDTAMARIPDGVVDVVTLSGSVGVTMTGAWTASLANDPYLEDQYVYLGSHHMYGSARLGIATYQPQQYQYRWDYLYGFVDSFSLSKSRPWYSYALNAPMNAGTLTPYGHGLDSNAEASHVIGMKQYELVNHLANVQETISDKKYNKDLNGDSVRDEYRATPIMVYDYYPFGELMPGRSLDTTGLCVTTVRYTVQQRTHWANPGVLYGGGGGGSGPASYGGAGLSASATYSAGVTATGTGGGLQYTISGIPTSFPTLNVYFSALAGTTQVRVYKGSGTGGMQLGSVNVSYTSPVTSIPLSGVIPVGSSTGTITVVVNSVGSYSSSVSLFSIDSIGYAWSYNTDVPYLATQCGNPTDKYEFGFNGQMKMNEIAGVGNHNTALFWEYDTRLGRRWNMDPVKKANESIYASFSNNPIFYKDILGNIASASSVEAKPNSQSSDSKSSESDSKNESSEQDGDGNKKKATCGIADGQTDGEQVGSATSSDPVGTASAKPQSGITTRGGEVSISVINGEASSANGQVSGSIEGKAGNASFKLQTPATGLGIAVEAKAAVATLEAKGSVKTANGQFGIAASGNGQWLAAEGSLTTPGTFGPYGKAEIGLYAVKGEATGVLTVFGNKIGGTIGGSAGSAHIGGGIGIHFNGEGMNIEVFEHIGWGLGEKLGFKIVVPYEKISH